MEEETEGLAAASTVTATGGGGGGGGKVAAEMGMRRGSERRAACVVWPIRAVNEDAGSILDVVGAHDRTLEKNAHVFEPAALLQTAPPVVAAVVLTARVRVPAVGAQQFQQSGQRISHHVNVFDTHKFDAALLVVLGILVSASLRLVGDGVGVGPRVDDDAHLRQLQQTLVRGAATESPAKESRGKEKETGREETKKQNE